MFHSRNSLSLFTKYGHSDITTLTSEGWDLLYCSLVIPNMDNITTVRYLLGIPGSSWNIDAAIKKARENHMYDIAGLLQSRSEENFLLRYGMSLSPDSTTFLLSTHIPPFSPSLFVSHSLTFSYANPSPSLSIQLSLLGFFDDWESHNSRAHKVIFEGICHPKWWKSDELAKRKDRHISVSIASEFK